MARSKSEAGKKAGGKAPRKVPVLSGNVKAASGGASKRKSTAGGRNSVCKRPVPEWQVPIGKFLTKEQQAMESAAGAAPEDTDIGDIEMPSTSLGASESAGLVSDKDNESTNADDADEEKDADVMDEDSEQNPNIDILEKNTISKEDVNDCDGKKDLAAASEEVTEIPKTIADESTVDATEEKDTDAMEEGSGQNVKIDIPEKKKISKEDVNDYDDEKDLAAASEEVTKIPQTMQNKLDAEETTDDEDTE